MTVIGFAGSGNMAAALARGFSRAGIKEGPMLFTDSGSGRAAALAKELGGEAAPDLGALATGSDVLILAVKPKALGDAAAEIGTYDGTLVSVLGATPLAALRAAFPEATVLRTMPNVGVEIGRGVICHAPIPDEERDKAEPALRLLGSVAALYELPEEQLDVATAVMGCSLAWIANACDAVAEAGAEAGLDPELAAEFIALSAAATGELLADHDAKELQRAVASPGGSTEAGLDALAERDAAGAFAYAVTAALERMEGKR
jgi:pyrroline-5-carboxylate reductase